MSDSTGDAFRHLGKQSNLPVDELDLIPWSGSRIVVRLECGELTSLCPVTGHPDFGELVVEFVPKARLVETKSLKLYLWRYRDEPWFNELLVDAIATDLFSQIEPHWLCVTGRFRPRGGIAVTAEAERGVREEGA